VGEARAADGGGGDGRSGVGAGALLLAFFLVFACRACWPLRLRPLGCVLEGERGVRGW
jgi:hypothetical protein